MIKRSILLGLCLALLLTLCSCSLGPEAENPELLELQKTGVLKVGVIACPPFTYCIDGEWSGFDIWLAREVCEKLKLEPEFVEVEWERRFEAMNNGEVDCIWCAVTQDDSLVEAADFSQTYLVSRPVLLIPKEGGTVTTIAAEGRSAAYRIANQYNTGAEIIPAASCVEAAAMVADGRANGAVVDVLYANALVNGAVRIQTEIDLGREEFCAAFRPGSDLTFAVNRILSDLERNGTLEKMAQRYGMTDSLIVG